MFSGIVEERGRIIALRRSGAGARLALQSFLDLSDLNGGESIAVDGVCLTVTAVSKVNLDAAAAAYVLEFDISEETLRRTTLGRVVSGQEVNIERALALGGRLDGHLVAGHVDGSARLISRVREGNSWRFVFRFPKHYLRYLAEKGSVAINGVSLTIGRVTGDRVALYLIPRTLEVTNLGSLSIGSTVNFEIDMLARYAERARECEATPAESIRHG